MSSRDVKTESSSSEDERQTNLILMRKTNSLCSSEDSYSNDKVNPTCDELFDKYKEIIGKVKQLAE